MTDNNSVPEVIAKEITIALIQKMSAPDIDRACKAYDQVLKQVVTSIREAYK